MGRLTAPADTLAALRRPEELYELLDPDVMWYSADVDSNCTCNDRDDVIACIERNAAAGLTGRFDVLGEGDDVAVVRAVVDPPRFGDAAYSCAFVTERSSRCATSHRRPRRSTTRGSCGTE